jgi:hypothetical protein
MLTRHRRLAVTACAVGMIAALAPAATASAAAAWKFPAPWPPSPPPTTGLSSVTGKLTFAGFPAGTTLTGGLATTWEKCVRSTNGRPFSVQAGATIDATIEPDDALFPDGCLVERPTQSVWRLYLSSPPPFAGVVIFGLSQDKKGGPYYMVCGPTEGAIQCAATPDHLELDVVSRPSLPGLLWGTGARSTQ